jgi:hypothetical protein
MADMDKAIGWLPIFYRCAKGAFDGLFWKDKVGKA